MSSFTIAHLFLPGFGHSDESFFMSLSPVLLRHALLLSAVSLLSACDGASSVEDSALVIEGNTMGTFYRVSIAGVDKNREAALRGQIEAQLKIGRASCRERV